jgi:hypothetical protein
MKNEEIMHKRLGHCGNLALRRIGCVKLSQLCDTCLKVQRCSKKKFRRVDLCQDQYGRIQWDISTLDTAIGGGER